MCDYFPDDNLMTWIADLRNRLVRGELAGLPGVDIGDGTGGMPAGWTIKVMLADLDSFDGLTPGGRLHPNNAARRRRLLCTFRRLRDLIG